MPQLFFQPSALSSGGVAVGTSLPDFGNAATAEPPKKKKKKPKKQPSVWLLPVLAGSGVLLVGGLILFIAARRRNRVGAVAAGPGSTHMLPTLPYASPFVPPAAPSAPISSLTPGLVQ